MTHRMSKLTEQEGKEVQIRGWLINKRSSGKIVFLQIRDGSRVVQAVASKGDLTEEAWDETQRVTQESTVRLTGTVHEDKRAPGGVEVRATDFAVEQLSEEFPIAPKDHGTAFLMEHRHLWLRSSRQRAALQVRSEVSQAIRDFFYQRDFVLIDSPILTPAACEGTATLFETDYFGDIAYLSQSGQLYLEPAAAAFGKVYCFGPTFRAEKSKTRRHLTEFWMVEPEVAFLEFDGLCELAEEFVVELVERVIDQCARELAVLERDTSLLLGARFARAFQLSVDPTLDVKSFLVVRALFQNKSIIRQRPAPGLSQLLELRLGVMEVRVRALCHRIVEHRQDGLAPRLQPPIEKERSEDRLHGVREQRGLLATPRPLFSDAESQVLTQIQSLGMPCKNGLADQVALELGEIALRPVRVGSIKPIGSH